MHSVLIQPSGSADSASVEPMACQVYSYKPLQPVSRRGRHQEGLRPLWQVACPLRYKYGWESYAAGVTISAKVTLSLPMLYIKRVGLTARQSR